MPPPQKGAVRKIKFVKIVVVQQCVKQGVYPGHCGKRIFRQLFHQPRNVARVSNEQVLSAQFNKQQAVHGQGKNVVER
jgi:hypothetical protein